LDLPFAREIRDQQSSRDGLSGFVGACPSDRELFTAENAEIRRDYVRGNAETLKTEIKRQEQEIMSADSERASKQKGNSALVPYSGFP